MTIENASINNILGRQIEEQILCQKLRDFYQFKKDPLFKRGIYVYGPPGSGKTQFVIDVIKREGYDIIRYDAGDIRNTKAMDEISKNRISDVNVYSIYSTPRKIVIVMDEIDGMNNGDKGGINLLINLIRQKKTKKQKLEAMSQIPIVCIGDCRVDKKITELMKICVTIELKMPTPSQIREIARVLYPHHSESVYEKLGIYAQGDLRKIAHIDSFHAIENYTDKAQLTGAKNTALELFHNKHVIEEHGMWINDTDRTSVGLLWHENVIELMSSLDNTVSIPIYLDQLDRICFADFIDRTTFQRQIWQFNEFSSLIKTFSNHAAIHHQECEFDKIHEVRFTKVLTKYSTEYNNFLFIKRLSNLTGLEKKDLLTLFIHLQKTFPMQTIITMAETYMISKLDVQRVYRYIDRLTKHITPPDKEQDVLSDIEDNEPFFEE